MNRSPVRVRLSAHKKTEDRSFLSFFIGAKCKTTGTLFRHPERFLPESFIEPHTTGGMPHCQRDKQKTEFAMNRTYFGMDGRGYPSGRSRHRRHEGQQPRRGQPFHRGRLSFPQQTVPTFPGAVEPQMPAYQYKIFFNSTSNPLGQAVFFLFSSQSVKLHIKNCPAAKDITLFRSIHMLYGFFVRKFVTSQP